MIRKRLKGNLVFCNPKSIRAIIFIFCSIGFLVLPACVPASPSASPVTMETLTSIKLPTLMPSSTTTLTAEPNPVETSSPAVTNQHVVTPSLSAPCFVTYYDPVAFMPDNIRFLVRAITGVQIFNLQTMKEVGFLKSPTNLNGPVVALSPDGEKLAWALENNTVQLIRVSDNKLLNILTGNTGPITKLRFFPTGGRLYSASQDGWVRIWDMDGKQVGSFQANEADVIGIAVSPDETMLATLPADGPVRIWKIDGYKTVRELGGSGGYNTSDVAFSPDGQSLAASLATGLALWKISNGTNLLNESPAINSMTFSFSPDGRYLAYSDANENNDILLVSPDGKQKIKTLKGHQMPVFRIVFSPDGSLLASADDEEIRVWHVEDGKLLYIGKSNCP